MKKILSLMLFGVIIGCTIFSVIGVVFDISFHGNFALTNWSYTKMVFGAMLIGIGFSVPALIYENKKLHYAAKVLIQMAIGCTILLVVAFSVGWVPVEAGWKVCALTIGGYLLGAVVIWLACFLHFKNEAKRLNEKIRKKSEE